MSKLDWNSFFFSSVFLNLTDQFLVPLFFFYSGALFIRQNTIGPLGRLKTNVHVFICTRGTLAINTLIKCIDAVAIAVAAAVVYIGLSYNKHLKS